MYNEELKERFISFYTINDNTISHCRRVFNVSCPYEEKWNRDICTMEISQLQTVVDNIVGVRGRSRIADVFILKKYILWCMANDYPNAINNIESVDLSGLSVIRKKMVANPTQLSKVLDAIFDPVERNTVDNTHRCYYWMAFSGVHNGEDALSAKCADVDLPSMSFYIRGRRYSIYKEALDTFRSCLESHTFVLHHPNYSERVLQRIEGDDLLRGVRKEKNVAYMRSELSHKNKIAVANGKTDTEISYKKLWRSGLFCEKYELERAGYEIKFDDDVDRLIKDGFYKCGADGSVPDYKRNQFIRDFQDEYERWKIAFAK